VKTWHEPIGEPTIAGSICDRLVHAPPTNPCFGHDSLCYVSRMGIWTQVERWRSDSPDVKTLFT